MSEEDEVDVDIEGLADDENIDDMYLTFEVNRELYAVGIAYVTEIVGVQNIVEVPDVPNFIKGVINLRGKVITVMDVRLRFGIEEKEYDDRTCIIVLEVDGVPTGLVVDGVNEVLEIHNSNIDSLTSWQDSGDQSVVKGMGKHDDKVSIVLDVQRLLYDDNTQAAIKEATAAAHESSTE